MPKEPVSQMGAGFLRYAGRRKAGAGGHVAAYHYESGVGVLRKLPNQSLSPSLCPSCARADTPLPPPCACVYSSPSRRTPVDAAARTPRTGYCGRRRRSDRPFRTGFIRWLVEGRVLSQAPVFHEFLESIYFFNFKVLFGRRVRSWLRTNAGGAPNTCKSRG